MLVPSLLPSDENALLAFARTQRSYAIASARSLSILSFSKSTRCGAVDFLILVAAAPV
jgi:hypothetical protein